MGIPSNGLASFSLIFWSEIFAISIALSKVDVIKQLRSLFFSIFFIKNSVNSRDVKFLFARPSIAEEIDRFSKSFILQPLELQKSLNYSQESYQEFDYYRNLIPLYPLSSALTH